MNSKIRSTYTVLMISSALVLGLLVAAPAAFPVADVAAALGTEAFAATVAADASRASPLTAASPVVAGLAATLKHTAATPAAVQQLRHASGKSRRIRQSMAMPFFSFAPRG